MGDFDPAFVHSLAVQSWSLYGVGIFLILLRIYARIRRLGLKGLQADNFIMVVAGCLYTVLIVCLNVISSGGGSNLYQREDFTTFTPKNIKERINGSKIVVVSEQAMLNVIYCVKAYMLILYTRLTLNHSTQRLVKYLACYVGAGWVATEIAFFTACTLFEGYLAVGNATPNPQCTTLEHYAIIQASFNMSSDTLMIFIPLPLITRLAVPWKQKLTLLFIFSMGTFVTIAAILTKVFNLSNVWDPSYMLWYTRERSVAVYVSNLPLIWPLLRDWFTSLRSFTPGNRSSSRDKKGLYAPNSSTGRTRLTASAGRHISGNFEGRIFSDDDGLGKTGVTTTIHGQGDSTDELGGVSISEGDDVEMGAVMSNMESEERLREKEWCIEVPMGGIHKSTTVHVSEEHITDLIAAVHAPDIPKVKRGHSAKVRDVDLGVVPQRIQG